ncbi:MAG: hypothetical protein U1F52_02000 [Burkholderiales bacterium]
MSLRKRSRVARRHAARTADLVGKLWALPTTLAGLALLAAGVVACIGLRRKGSVHIGYNAIAFTGHPFVGTAIALGNVVTYGRQPACQPDSVRRPSGRCLAHEEMQHTIQAQWLGPLYLPAHLVFGVAALILHGRWHGPANLLEAGPHAREPRPWPWRVRAPGAARRRKASRGRPSVDGRCVRPNVDRQPASER